MGLVSDLHGLKTIYAEKSKKKKRRPRSNLSAQTKHQMQAFSQKKSLKGED